MSALPCVICYDIASDRRRRQVRKVLAQWRLDGQKSVVETRLSRGEARELFLQLAELIDPDTDRLALAWLCTPVQVVTRGSGRNTFRQHWIRG